MHFYARYRFDKPASQQHGGRVISARAGIIQTILRNPDTDRGGQSVDIGGGHRHFQLRGAGGGGLLFQLHAGGGNHFHLHHAGDQQHGGKRGQPDRQ